jgi:hypothetical protein
MAELRAFGGTAHQVSQQLRLAFAYVDSPGCFARPGPGKRCLTRYQ